MCTKFSFHHDIKLQTKMKEKKTCKAVKSAAYFLCVHRNAVLTAGFAVMKLYIVLLF